jgi:hypothetical protein
VATITSAQSGDFSDTATWVGGVVPGVGDVAVAATGHVIVIDVDVTVDEVDQAGTGKFTLGNGRTLTANVTARAGTFTSGGTVEVVATSGNTATIVGNVTGVSTTAANVAGVVVSGNGRLEIEGDITGSAGNVTAANENAMLYVSGAGEVEVTGNATQGGNSKHGIKNVANSTIILNGNAVGGTGSLAHGIDNAGAATITVNGNLLNARAFRNSGAATIQINGNLLHISAVSAFVIENSGASTINVDGNIVSGSNAFSIGLFNTGAATISVLGEVTANAAPAVNNTNASASITLIGPLQPGSLPAVVNTQADAVLQCTGPFLVSAAGIQAVQSPSLRFFDDRSTFFEIRSSDLLTIRTLYSTNNPDSQSGQPASTDVRSGVTYGPLGEITGTCAVPPPTAVASGVPVDATTGEAVLRQADAAAIFGAIWEQG